MGTRRRMRHPEGRAARAYTRSEGCVIASHEASRAAALASRCQGLGPGRRGGGLARLPGSGGIDSSSLLLFVCSGSSAPCLAPQAPLEISTNLGGRPGTPPHAASRCERIWV